MDLLVMGLVILFLIAGLTRNLIMASRPPDSPEAPFSAFALRRLQGVPSDAFVIATWCVGVSLFIVFFLLGKNPWYIAFPIEIALFFALNLWLVSELDQAKPKRKTVLAENERDFKISLAIRDAMEDVPNRIPPTNDLVPGTVIRNDLAVGELTRHFDTETVGSITGWLQHSLSGWGSSRSTTSMWSGHVSPGRS